MNGHFMEDDEEPINDHHVLDTVTNTSLACPDFGLMRSERRDRTRATMKALNPGLTKRVLPEAETLSRRERSVICIQSHYRGYLARKKYVELLYEQFNKEDELRAAKAQKQVEEGELLVENHKLEVEFEENHCIRRNRQQRLTAHVITIQRAWRRFKRRKHHRHSNRGVGGAVDGDDGRGGRDANGNCWRAARDWGLGVDQRGNRPTRKRGNESESSQGGVIKDWDIKTDSNRMTSTRRSKTHAMLQDLGSSVELDDNHVYESSPEISDKKKNRLSLAEEFAAAMDEDDGMSGDVADCEDSDLNESSSCATTPEWDTSVRQSSELILEVPSSDILADTLRNKCSLESEETNPNTMQERSTHTPDPNKNYSVDSDQNANDVPLERCDLTRDSTNHERNSRVRVNERASDERRNEPLLRNQTSSPNRTGGNWSVTHPRLQRCASAESKGAELTPHHGVTCSSVPQIQTDCVEPTMPVLDWESLEKHLAKMEKEEEQQSYKQTQKNSRQAILRKLAMGTDDEAEGDIYGKSKDKLSTRLQSGMNLQICFVNEPVDGSDGDEDSPRILAAEESCARSESHVTNRFGRVTGSGNRLTTTGMRLSRESSSSSSASHKTPSVTFRDAEDFETQQARLQDEARVALARAEPLARMQMELERQQRRKSPVTELAGVSGMTDICDRLWGKKLTHRALRNMSISKLQFVVNDLHSQIESLNEELVQVLIRRDELQMEQDSKLIDIEDLTRWIRMNMQQNNNNNTIMGKQPLENGRKRQYETLLKLLGSTLPVSRKCFCGLSRSSSVVSSRSASSPEIQEMASSPLSPQTSICRSASSMSINESRASSPEMTWVRQAMIKYWYN